MNSKKILLWIFSFCHGTHPFQYSRHILEQNIIYETSKSIFILKVWMFIQVKIIVFVFIQQKIIGQNTKRNKNKYQEA